MESEELEKMNTAISKPHGIILVTGPTGSGKTTTLYACLNRLNSRDRKIVTIEDPIEYLIPNITQIQINNNIKLSFAKGLRSILRHDPDIIMLGEIRDFETADIAIQAALTGHLVFSTLHTNDAPSTIARLIDIGLEHFLVSSSLQCVIAQRLVRVLCSECKEKEEILPEIKKDLPLFPENINYAYVAKGCAKCNFTGYFGRTGIFEIILIDDEFREMIQLKTPVQEIRRFVNKKGIKSLRIGGYEKLVQGLTTLDEVLRVTAESI